MSEQLCRAELPAEVKPRHLLMRPRGRSQQWPWPVGDAPVDIWTPFPVPISVLEGGFWTFSHLLPQGLCSRGGCYGWGAHTGVEAIAVPQVIVQGRDPFFSFSLTTALFSRSPENRIWWNQTNLTDCFSQENSLWARTLQSQEGTARKKQNSLLAVTSPPAREASAMPSITK